jgi:O-antigen/teichoic acid export membrane protein
MMLAQFGGADWALPLKAGEPGADRTAVFSLCTAIALRALPIVWGISALMVVLSRPGGSLTITQYGLFMAGLLPAGYAAWQLFVLRYARRSDEFAAGTLSLKTVAPAAALTAALVWPITDQRMSVFLSVSLAAYFMAAVYVHRLRNSVLTLHQPAAGGSPMRPFLATGLTLLPGGLAYTAIWSADRIVANALWGPEAAGIVGVAALLGSSVLLLKVWLALLWEPLVVEWSGKALGDALTARIQRGFDWTALSFLSAATLGVIWGPWVIVVLYPSDLAPATGLLPWYFAAACVSGIAGIASATILLARAPRVQLAVQLTALVVCVMTMMIATPRLGLEGVVAGVLAAELTLISTWLYLGRYHFKNLPLRLDRLSVMGAAFGFIGIGCSQLRSHGILVEITATMFVALVASAIAFGLTSQHREVQIA